MTNTIETVMQQMLDTIANQIRGAGDAEYIMRLTRAYCDLACEYRSRQSQSSDPFGLDAGRGVGVALKAAP